MTFRPNTRLKESQNELIYGLRTEEGPFATLVLNTDKNFASLRIGDRKSNTFCGRHIRIKIDRNTDDKIKKRIVIGNCSEGKLHGFVRLIRVTRDDSFFYDTTAFKNHDTCKI